ncbi:MAG TPA: DUF4097 family beta strand repeat-containing protein [Vicinamibacterales bacterium]|jgi:DUF4097 and DUF4098 domain-containing protein YvlB
MQMTGMRLTQLVAAVALVVGAAGAAPAAEFDRTVPVSKGTRLDVRLFGGEVVVRAWDKDAVRVRATHFRLDTIEIATARDALTVRTRAAGGAPHAIDFTIDVPSWMAITVGGTYLDVSIEGTRGDVTAETVRGDIKVVGGAGTIVLKSVDGQVSLDDGRGRVELHAVNEGGIRATGVKGDLVAETVNGEVTLERVEGATVEVSTVGGDISWDGTMTPGGRYQFATHSGGIDVSLDPQASVSVNVRAYQGVFRARLAVELPSAAARSKRFSFVLGTGASRLDLETFTGTITIRGRTERPARRR